MKLGKARLVGTGLFLLFLLAAIPAYGQRGNFDINVGQTTDKFGSLAPSSGLDFDFTGQFAVIQREAKNSGPSIVAGGEVRVSGDHSYHATEFAVYGGPAFRVHNFSIGLNAQVRKILLPPSTVNNQVFVRGNLEFFQLPIVIKYKFGPAQRAFVEVQGEPEFTPHFLAPKTGVSLAPSEFRLRLHRAGKRGLHLRQMVCAGNVRKSPLQISFQSRQSQRPLQLEERDGHRRRGHNVLRARCDVFVPCEDVCPFPFNDLTPYNPSSNR